MRVDEVEIGYDEAGSGPPVVLVHGGLVDRRLWDHQFDALSRRFRVIRYDWRGYGRSGDAEGACAHHEDLLGLMTALDVPAAALVGNSFGGAYAVDAALTAPDRVTALVLISAGLSGHDWPDSMGGLVRRFITGAVPPDRLAGYQEHTAGAIEPADVTAMARAQLRLMAVGPDREPADVDPEMLARAQVMCELVFEREWAGPITSTRWLDPPAAGRLGEITAPTLVINGLADVPEIQEVSDLLTKGIAGAGRIDLPDTGHLPPLERPAEVTAALLDFLPAG